MKNVWKDLPRPIFILAPMDGVTDSVFRGLIAEIGKPDILFTEFTNVDGLASRGRDEVLKRFVFKENEHPIIAQIWGTSPENFYKAGETVREMGFDGVDINMGCPVRSIVMNGSCSALINNEKLAAEIIQATKEGSNNLPISVKTRIGTNKIETERWIPFLLNQQVDALIIHGRTAKEMSLVPAHWDEIGKTVQLKNQISSNTVIIGNGDVKSLAEAHEKVLQFGVDGVMFGRGIFQNPWLFNTNIDIETVPFENKLKLLLRHVELFEGVQNRKKPFDVLKKYFKIYVNGFDNASDLRDALMHTESIQEAQDLVQKHL